MAWLDIMVTYSLCIVLHVVDDRSGKVLIFWHHIVRPIDAGLSLQNIAVVDQQQMVAIRCAFLFNICVCTGERTLNGLTLHEVVREEVTVNVAGLNHFHSNSLGLLS